MPNEQTRSLSVVALLTNIPSTGHLGGAQAQRFTLEGEDLDTQTADFLGFARHYVGRGRKVIALYPKWHRERAERAIKFARGALRTDHVAGVEVDLSPLALSLVSDQLAYMAPYLPSGLIAALADEMPHHLLAGAWLPSVSKLASLPTSVKQHVGSYSPNIKFLAFNAPVQRVGRVKKDDPRPNLPFRPAPPVQVLVSHSEGFDTTTFDKQFMPILGSSSTRVLPEQQLGSRYWGTKRYIEFVAFSAHQNALTEPVHAIRPITCAWCREPVVRLSCPFCGTHNQPPAGRPPIYSKASEVPAPVNTHPQSRKHGPAKAALDRYAQQQESGPQTPPNQDPTQGRAPSGPQPGQVPPGPSATPQTAPNQPPGSGQQPGPPHHGPPPAQQPQQQHTAPHQDHQGPNQPRSPEPTGTTPPGPAVQPPPPSGNPPETTVNNAAAIGNVQPDGAPEHRSPNPAETGAHRASPPPAQ